MPDGPPPDGPASGRSVVFFHAHPDDEAIFTGGTMALLAAAGWRVVLVFATAGEQGETSASVGPDVPLAVRRMGETARAAECLGAQRVEFLGYHDSGLDNAAARTTGAGGRPPGAFADASVEEASTRLAGILAEEQARALVSYDARGIYGHVDHVQVHRVGLAAAAKAAVPTVYESTVDREYLHFVETHLVVEATVVAQPERAVTGLGLAAAPLGLSTVEVDCTVDVRPVLPVKRRAMAAHASQIPETSSAMRLPDADFAAVYGYEWYARRGPLGPIDTLT
ncbi:MAG TPA: PIG-L family deacetylase [Acidimicrobiia bacterium]|nr:PIG-L family deacetylase [Acidimicrobiia bacterium]HMC79259.1 PIG-L family deacetylase [Acidimicrobiia bacterium]HTC81476.1 PIG-L family deacetylase [Acidimicrobiia bacterium]